MWDSMWLSARFRMVSMSLMRASAISRSSALVTIFMSTMTWSFLLRPVWTMPPTSTPIFSMTRPSMYSWTSSYSAPISSFPSRHSCLISSRAFSISLRASAGITPCSWSIMSWASVPSMSYSNIRRSSTTLVWNRAVLSSNFFESLDLNRLDN